MRRRDSESPSGWSRTARRLDEEFKVSVGVVNGKRCLGGMLELLMHCHYLLAVDGAQLGMPEVTLPVVPGMEGCHWPFRKSKADDWGKVLTLLLSGRPVRASEAVGWLIDYAGSLEDTLGMAWTLASDGEGGLPRREVEGGVLAGVPTDVPGLPKPTEKWGGRPEKPWWIASRAPVARPYQRLWSSKPGTLRRS